MGVTNLKVGLERKYATWLAEKKKVDKEIAEILGAYQKLAEKQIRAAQLTQLIDASQVILKEIAPNWDADKVKPKMPRDWSRNFETGSITRWALDALRESGELMTSRAIALQIAEKNDVDPDNKDLIERIRQSVDATLRSKMGKLTEKHGEYPSTWKLIDFDDRPEAMPSKP